MSSAANHEIDAAHLGDDGRDTAYIRIQCLLPVTTLGVSMHISGKHTSPISIQKLEGGTHVSYMSPPH